MNELDEYYSHIASKINSRQPFRYNLQDQPIEVKNKYLPVDLVDYRLKQEANQEYPITIILDFLNKRNASQINPQLLKAFSSRKGYLMDIGSNNDNYQYGLDLSQINIYNYEIDSDGNVSYRNGDEIRYDTIRGINKSTNMPQEELNELYGKLNQYVNQYFNKYISNTINNLDTLLENFEYKPDEWDNNRAIENGNIYSKLALLLNSPNYLIQMGLSEEEINNIHQKITNKYNEIKKPYEKTTSQKEYDLDFLSAVFDDLNMTWRTIEYDLQKEINEEEFVSLYTNVDYMIKLFEKYITITQDKKFNFTDYNISKDDLQQLLNDTIRKYQKKKEEKEETGIIKLKKTRIIRVYFYYGGPSRI